MPRNPRAPARPAPASPAEVPPGIRFIEKPDDLEALLGGWKGARLLAVDTEAASFHRFHDRVYLVQLSTRDETAIIGQHVEHDGWPRRLAEFARVDGARELAMLLARCLRRDPKIRPPAREVRRALALAAHNLESRPWPLPVSRNEQPSPSEAPIPLVAGRR